MQKKTTILNVGYQVRTYLEVLSILKRGGPTNLAGYCAVGSSLFHNLLEAKNISNTFILGAYKKDSKRRVGHCWIQIGKKIIDITATQFQISNRLYLSNIENKKYIKLYKNLDALEIIEKGWPEWQKPSTYINDFVPIATSVHKTIMEKQC